LIQHTAGAAGARFQPNRRSRAKSRRDVTAFCL